MKHIGLKIKDLVDKKNYPKSKFAADLEMTENNLYKIFKKESIDTSLLYKIADLLEVDITYFFSNDTLEITEPVKIGQSKNDKDDYYKDKLVSMLEERVKALENDKNFLKGEVEYFREITKNLVASIGRGELGKLLEIRDSQPATIFKVSGERASDNQ